MSTTVLDLNDDCIAYIFKCLPIDNHMKLASACTRFRYVWQGYRKCLYKRLELGSTSSEGLNHEMLLLRQISRYVKHVVLNLNRNFTWTETLIKEITRTLSTMTALERVLLWLRDSEPYEIYECILRSLEHLPNLKGIATYQDNDVVDSLYQFRDCEELLMESKMSRDPLIESIDNHTKIRMVILDNASIQPSLQDLVRHSTCIKELSFRMTQKAVEYAPLAKLPDLSKLQIFGNRLDDDYGSLMPLVAAVSNNLSQQLHTLSVHAPGLGYQETVQIARMKTLRRLDCFFSDPQCLELLIALDQLRDLFIQLPKCSPIDDLVLNLLKNCHNLNVLQIDSPNLGHSFLVDAHQVLQKVRNPSKQKPLILMLGDKSVVLDEDMSSYLKVYWQDSDNYIL